MGNNPNDPIPDNDWLFSYSLPKMPLLMKDFEEKVKLMDLALRACKVTTNEREIRLMLSISNALDANENISLQDILRIYTQIYSPSTR